MSNAQPVHEVHRGAGRAPVRVRDQAREAAGLMLFSASASAGLAVALLVLTHLGR